VLQVYGPLMRTDHIARDRMSGAPGRRTFASGLLIVLALGVSGSEAGRARSVSAGTVPFIFDDNRIYAELSFVRPDGTLRTALAFVDPGTPALEIHERLRDDLRIAEVHRIVLRVGALEIQRDSSAVTATRGSFSTGRDGKATVPVEAVLPGSVMKDYAVTFDYARRRLTLEQSGASPPAGVTVPVRVNARTGLPSVTADIGGRPYALALDVGSAYSWVRDDVARGWMRDHPEWATGTGAVGEANMQTRTGGAEANATILRIPEIRLGALRLTRIGALGIASDAPPFPPAPGEGVVRGDFFDWYSKKASEPVIGWLGGNVLKGFRLTIDFPRRVAYWTPQRDLDPHDLDQVGITLETHDGVAGFFVAGIARHDGTPTVEGVQVGDQLLQVDNLQVGGATRGAVFSALHGRAGTVRRLVVQRQGRQITVRTTTTAF
jgi:hypothetical protein